MSAPRYQLASDVPSDPNLCQQQQAPAVTSPGMLDTNPSVSSPDPVNAVDKGIIDTSQQGSIDNGPSGSAVGQQQQALGVPNHGMRDGTKPTVPGLDTVIAAEKDTSDASQHELIDNGPSGSAVGQQQQALGVPNHGMRDGTKPTVPGLDTVIAAEKDTSDASQHELIDNGPSGSAVGQQQQAPSHGTQDAKANVSGLDIVPATVEQDTSPKPRRVYRGLEMSGPRRSRSTPGFARGMNGVQSNGSPISAGPYRLPCGEPPAITPSVDTKFEFPSHFINCYLETERARRRT